MEFKTQNSTSSKQIRWNSNDEGGQRQFRSYTCTFCKRGFSNAQALGGHMNIHRRDRAKLKQSYEENLLSLDISLKNTRNDSWEEEEVASNHKMPFTFPPPAAGNDNGFASQWGKVIGAAELAHLPSLVGRLTADEGEKDDLDLELKLGPAEPQKAPTLGMREFF